MDVRGLRALICVLVVVACLLALVSAPFAVAADAGTQRAALQDGSDGTETDSNESVELEDADRIHIDVVIAEDGSAQVTADHQFDLYGENNSTAEWEALNESLSNDRERYVEEERDSWNDTLEKGQNETNREMNISGVSITTEVDSQPREIGHAKVSFTWSQFALTEMTQLKAGDALSGFTLGEGTTLQFHWPEGYTVYENEGERQIDPSPSELSEGSVSWQGDSFTDDQPRVVLAKSSDSNSSADQTPSDGGPAMPWVIVLLALALLATVGVVGWLVGRNSPGDDGTDTGSDKAWRTDGSTDVDSSPSGDQPPDGPPPELLSNEERVLRLLERRGGRVKQQEVVSELDWTEAKTSQVVGDLREDDEIDVFRIGRENVLALPEDESRR
ncbi:hypothetical protein CP556_06255 [Natrinema sp. CBA1119]|uniref:helix-turn-helix transcriptional regulator n=1 Tax=Natrinema sp. CBA1119 TaxID=1608465 RepID=UPI000BF51044|nr:hypothetical protein [Natrinema sp. CBA1119]PGF15756.1 hypothetical protein CP556_06255 [Natrinema sp. CBA1119]